MFFSNMYDMHHIQEPFLTFITWWFQHTDLFQNEVIPLLHGTLQFQNESGCDKLFRYRAHNIYCHIFLGEYF